MYNRQLRVNRVVLFLDFVQILTLEPCFPKQDFYNLVDVYLDAVFFPKCVEDYQTFQQEGWHFELNDPSEEISYKGCTF